MPLGLFIRIDDFGAPSISMRTTFKVLLEAGLSVHVAVVPAWLTSAGARLLAQLYRTTAHRIEIGQHGYKHTERRAGVRRFEVGPGMSASAQRIVIARGRAELRKRLGFDSSRVFTPPFNGYDEITVAVLGQLGFEIVSAQERSSTLQVPYKPRELSINVDALATYYPPRLKDVDTVVTEVATVAKNSLHVGIMLHPDLVTLSTAWLTCLARRLTTDARYQPVTLSQLAAALGTAQIVSRHVIGTSTQ